MLSVSEKANGMITNFLKDHKDLSYIRLFLSQGG